MGLCCAGGVSGAEGSGFCTAPVSAGAAVGFLRSAGVGPVLLVHSSWAGRAAFLHPERSAAPWRMGGGGTTTSGCAVLSAHRAPHSAPLAAQRCSVGVSPPPAPILSP